MDLLLAVLQNLKTLVQVAGIVSISLVGLLLIGMAMAADFNEDRVPQIRPWVFRLAGVAAACGLVWCVPSIQDLWEARIALVKYELASPENVKAGTEEIARVAHKLECKYLGCDKDSK